MPMSASMYLENNLVSKLYLLLYYAVHFYCITRWGIFTMKEQMEIVVIEDNEEDAARILKFLHTHFSNDVIYISDGAEAVSFLMFRSDSKPKLILLDVILPSVDGIELFHIIRAEPRSREIYVVFLINSLQTKEYIESRGITPNGYLLKPKNHSLPCRIESGNDTWSAPDREAAGISSMARA